MSTTRPADCRKFSPNIFNKSKCSHCFRQREEHSAAALECNRASRKVSKCGYLFVAPDWDFSNPLYRTKRWQRRWFVLYDDGELTYSVDDHPETVPQACIDMTKVLEVAKAEDVTGHADSIAITAPDRVTFVKGTCPEESKWWLNILVAFPKSKGRHKRNATFPGGQATTAMLQMSSDAYAATTPARNRHNSYHKDALTSAQSAGVLIGGAVSEQQQKQQQQLQQDDDDDEEDEEDDGVETGEDDEQDADEEDEDEEEEDDEEDDEDDVDVGDSVEQKLQTNDELTRTKTKKITQHKIGQDDKNRNDGKEISSKVSSSRLLIEGIRRDEKTIKDIANTITNLSQQQKTPWSNTIVNNVLNSHLHHTGYTNNNNNSNNNNNNSSNDDKNMRDETDFHRPTTQLHQQQHQQQPQPKSLPLASNSTPAIVSAIVKKIPPVLATSNTSYTAAGNTATSDANNSSNNNNNKSSLLSNKCKSSPRLQLQLKNLQQQHESINQQRQHHQQQQQQKQQAHERGDPDGGCNQDDLCTNYLAKTAELRVNPPAEESLNTKKGWLMKQDNRTGDWTKHWFSLSGAALFYYRDPVSEERGVLDGVLDVNSITNVVEVNASKSYAFQLVTWDQRRLTLASLSPTSRNSWMAILRNTAGLPAPQPASNNSSTANTVTVTPEKDKVPQVELVVIKDTSAAVCDIKSEIEQDFIKAQRNHDYLKQPSYQSASISATEHKKRITDASPQVNVNLPALSTKSTALSPVTPTTPKTAHFSSDEEYRTASEGGRRDSVDWGSPLSPSPPILRTRERLNMRTNVGVMRPPKRSHSSPPTSRRSTVDSVGSDDLSPVMQPVQEEVQPVNKELQLRLSIVEKERNMLRDEAKERETRMSELLTTLERTEQELNARIQEMEEVRDHLTTQLEDAKRNADEIVEQLTHELDESQKKVKDLEDRLARGIDENETLYKRVRELEGCSLNSFTNLHRSKLKRMDSLSDLTQIGDIDPYLLERDALADEYSELRSRFEKAVNEIRAMKRELKESQNQFDSLEISYAALKQDLERKETEDRAQLQMMAARIQDLTLKYSSSERQVRTLKQKMAKSERRRSLSLKGKEQLTVSKELELKVSELEAKIDDMEKLTGPPAAATESVRAPSKKSSRRRSLESSGNTDPLQIMLRLNDLEKRCEGAPATGSLSSSASATPACSTPTNDGSARNSVKVSEHLIERLRCLESVLVSSKDRLEQGLQQLQNLRSSHSRRSVSPITDRKDSYRFVERCLSEVVKLMRESCDTCIISGSSGAHSVLNVMLLPDSSPVKIALTQLESQLRTKLADLLKQRRVLRERNELTERKNMELLAERIAYESVCFGKLRDSMARAENPELFGERQTRAEVAETSHLMTMLKAKLSGKCALKSSGTTDMLAGVLARRLMLSKYRKDKHGGKSVMEPVDQNIMDDLLRQQNEMNLIVKRYKNNAMENLATGLAAETLSYISSNDLVQGAVQEAWRQAQETVNAELVQSEIAHIMIRNAERFESSITPSFGYTLTAEERLSFEKFADAVHDALRKEMELAVTQLTQCYKEAIQKMKRGQWRMQLQQERKVSEGRQLLTDFADIIAHKALVDARIAVLRGEYVAQDAPSQTEQSSERPKIGITTLEKYESLFEELSNDLQIDHPDEMLLEADFEFIYKQHSIDFLNDRQVLSEISAFLTQLEDSLIALQCEAAATTNAALPRSSISIESLQDVCHKCGDLRQRADQLRQEIQRALNTPCPQCRQVHDQLVRLQQQHESEMARLQQTHAKELNAYVQQVENQRNAFKLLEAEKHAINSDLHKSEELMEERERELEAINNKLKTKEAELKAKHDEQRELLQHCDEQEEKLQAYQEESNALTMKCVRQDEEYAVLLQERDYLQAELNKEKERSRRFEKRLEMLELEHSKQLECLQETYRDQLLSHCTDFSNATDDDSFRQRYQAEIEQLRTLCEKGLSAMESSHRRIIADLEEKHREEIERLLVEKETALAEETQATLAALDAMRKAHQSEVQREVARFKQEFLKQFQKGEHSPYTAKAKEEELEELRREILSFSEKFSIKCVENATLEEKLRSTNQKLRQLQQMQQLQLRNKQFRAHLAAEDSASDAQFVQGLTSGKDDEATCNDSEPPTHAHVEYTADVPVTVTLSSSTKIVPAYHATSSLVSPTTTTTTTSTTNITTASNINNNNNNNPSIISATSHVSDAYTAGQQVSKTTITAPNAVNKSDSDDDHDDDDDNELSSCYSYEPCYKQSNLYYFQSRMSFEGLRSSTFGKKLRSSIRKSTTTTTTTGTTTTTTSTSASTPKNAPTSSTTTINITTPITNTKALYVFNKKQQEEERQQSTNQTTTLANPLYSHHPYEMYLQKQQQQQKFNNRTKVKATGNIKTPITKPVEQPKITSANTINHIKNYNYNNHLDKHNNDVSNVNKHNNHVNNANKIHNTKLLNVSHLSVNNANSAINLISHKQQPTTTKTAAATIKIAERNAINLNSFTDFIKKTTATTKSAKTKSSNNKKTYKSIQSSDDVGYDDEEMDNEKKVNVKESEDRNNNNFISIQQADNKEDDDHNKDDKDDDDDDDNNKAGSLASCIRGRDNEQCPATRCTTKNLTTEGITTTTTIPTTKTAAKIKTSLRKFELEI